MYFEMYDRQKRYRRKSVTKLKRGKGYVEFIENPFPKDIMVEMHHINDCLVIPIPRLTHRLNRGAGWKEQHKNEMLRWITKIYHINIEKIIDGE